MTAIDTTDWLKPAGHKFKSQLELMRHRAAGGWVRYMGEGPYAFDDEIMMSDAEVPGRWTAAEPPLPEIKRHPYCPEVEPTLMSMDGEGWKLDATGGEVDITGPYGDTKREAIEAWNALVDATAYTPAASDAPGDKVTRQTITSVAEAVLGSEEERLRILDRVLYQDAAPKQSEPEQERGPSIEDAAWPEGRPEKVTNKPNWRRVAEQLAEALKEQEWTCEDDSCPKCFAYRKQWQRGKAKGPGHGEHYLGCRLHKALEAYRKLVGGE